MQATHRGLSRRDFLRLSGGGLAAATLLGTAACGGGGQQSGGGGQQGGGGGNAITVGLDQEPAILNGFIIGGDLVATSSVTNPIMDQVIEPQPDLSYAPVLADGMPQITSEDPLTIEFRLKEGLTFSDGEPLTSDDWRFTYETVMNEDNDIISRETWDVIETVETPDDRTVRIIFSEPDARWRVILTSSVLPRHIYEGENFNQAANNEITGSGPFRLREWNKGQNLILERNPNYWGEEPALETITYRFIPDTNSLITALESGELDFINPPPDVGLIERLEGIGGATAETAFGTVWEHLAFNNEVVSDRRIREAMALSVDRGQLIDEVLQGQAKALQSVLVPDQGEFYNPAWERYSLDVDRARQLVQEAEADGVSTEIRYSTTSDNRLRETTQQIIQQQMEKIGITLNIQNSSAETFFGEQTPSGDFELGQWAWSADPDPSITTLFSASNLPPDGQNYYRYESEEATRLMEQSDVAIDEDERIRLIRQAQEVMAGDVPLIPLYQRPETYAFNEALSGPVVNPTIAGAFWNTETWTLGG